MIMMMCFVPTFFRIAVLKAHYPMAFQINWSHTWCTGNACILTCYYYLQAIIKIFNVFTSSLLTLITSIYCNLIQFLFPSFFFLFVSRSIFFWFDSCASYVRMFVVHISHTGIRSRSFNIVTWYNGRKTSLDIFSLRY